jgi:hypothetical protein
VRSLDLIQSTGDCTSATPPLSPLVGASPWLHATPTLIVWNFWRAQESWFSLLTPVIVRPRGPQTHPQQI